MKFFLLFLFYKSIALACSASILLTKCQQEDFGFLDMLIEETAAAVVMLISMSLTLALVLFLAVNLKLVAQNKTMVELGFGIKSRHYDKGTCQNLADVFGHASLVKWLSPFHRAHPVKLALSRARLLELTTPVHLS